VNRLALLLGSNIWGTELDHLRRVLTECLDRFSLDSSRIGVWGLSMGGAYAMFWMPLDMRLRVGIVSGWFNHRRLKMAVPDPAYTCFLETEEEHAFLPGWLSHFSDSDLVSLICPRPLLIQTGRTDSVSDPDRVRQEWSAAYEHYRLLQRAERLRWDLHNGGHCVHLQTGIDFIQRYLLAADARANGISASTSVD
ncbi:hypothetical protein JW992_03820, partial [candidate division KSB1 bacterium]|nr:hypothetical protein [candidate division KSB1 bacterium]